MLNSQETVRNVWLEVALYAVLLFANGGACIGWLRKWLWMPVEQYSYDGMFPFNPAFLIFQMFE
jgi:hypothetical protein